ncbi:MAG TPA: DUF3788 domain-containing protein [Pyrinomonadaceae bacterium]|nr:DUF3788 domain-containing protein [Pyrinomonadaceae bacterium]
MPTQVAANAFIGKKEQPTEAELTTALGPAKQAWQKLLSELAQEYRTMTTEWKSHSIKWGWTLRVMRGKRTILWLSPHEGCFGVAFIFGGKAMTALEQCKLPKRIIKAISEAKKYPEGTGVRLEVKKAQEVSVLKKLVAIKVAN